MSTDIAIVLGAIAIAAFAYPLIMRAIARAVQPSRLEMAALGDELLGSPYVSDDDKNTIEAMLGDAFNWRNMVLLALLLPLRAPAFILNRSKAERHWPKISDDATRAKFERFMGLGIRSDSAANPIFALICGVEVALLTVLMVPLGKVSWQLPLFVNTTRESERLLAKRFC
ncbi:hypothetical protein FRZ61_47470 [Hypericibacter adhaerens]|jgi:hypothetical protein|uniref:Uncharacterized protein n=1 Tax=Hypericibacter adhaerens TaxID=2602016 RepID=A0A5J6N725_9PROT|nr:hypothetical protein [Hypericibacter adhaerens]QEX24805.1 hypothetical protein FRZ61_47470 [Hypericibacter adhaerens]